MEIIHIRDSDSEDSVGEPLEISNSRIKSNYNARKFVTNYGAGYCRKHTYKLPKSFFHSPNNVYLLNKCQPLHISLVDCKKYPWHFWKNAIHLGLNHKFTYHNTDTPRITKAVDVIYGPDNFKNKYDVIIKTSKNNFNESILADERSEKPLPNQSIADLKIDAEVSHSIIENPSKKPYTEHLDFRKNKGLEGLKIQHSEYIPTVIKPLPCSQDCEVIENVTQHKIKPLCKSNDLNLDKTLSVEKRNSKSIAKKKQAKQKSKQEISCEKKTVEEKTKKKHNTKANKNAKCNKTLESTQLKKHSGVSSKSQTREVSEKQMSNFPFKPIEPINPKLTISFDLIQQNTRNNGNKTHNLVKNTLRQENTKCLNGGKAMNLQASFKEKILISEVIEDLSPCIGQNHKKLNNSNEIVSTHVKKQSVDYENKILEEILPNYRSRISILAKKKNIDSGTKLVPTFVGGLHNKEMKLFQPSGFNSTSFSSNLYKNNKVDIVSAAQIWQQSCHTAGGIPRNAYIYQEPEEQYAQGINMQNTYCNQGNPTSYLYLPMQPETRFNVCSSANNDTCWPQNHIDLQVLPQKPAPSILFDSNLLNNKPTSNSDSVIGFNNNGIVRKINISEPKLLRQNNNSLIRNNTNDCNSYKQKHRILIKKITTLNSNSECSRRIAAPGLTSVKPQNFERHKKVYPELTKALSSAPKSTLAFKDVSSNEHHQKNSSSKMATYNAAPYLI